MHNQPIYVHITGEKVYGHIIYVARLQSGAHIDTHPDLTILKLRLQQSGYRLQPGY